MISSIVCVVRHFCLKITHMHFYIIRFRWNIGGLIRSLLKAQLNSKLGSLIRKDYHLFIVSFPCIPSL